MVYEVVRSLQDKFFARQRDRMDWCICTFVRDPFARALSARRNKLIDPDETFRPLRRMMVTERLAFEEFFTVYRYRFNRVISDHFMVQALCLANVQNRPELNILYNETLVQGCLRVLTGLPAVGSSLQQTFWHHSAVRQTACPKLTQEVRTPLNQLSHQNFERFGYEQS